MGRWRGRAGTRGPSRRRRRGRCRTRLRVAKWRRRYRPLYIQPRQWRRRPPLTPPSQVVNRIHRRGRAGRVRRRRVLKLVLSHFDSGILDAKALVLDLGEDSIQFFVHAVPVPVPPKDTLQEIVLVQRGRRSTSLAELLFDDVAHVIGFAVLHV